MFVYEAIIIYLAAGAPLAVMNLLKTRKVPKAAFWLNFLYVLVLWLPLVMFAGLKRLPGFRTDSAFVDYARLDADIGRRVREIAGLFNERPFVPFERTKKEDVLEPLERYAALSLAIGRENVVSSSDKPELFRISDHKDEEIAARCLERRNMRRLAQHRDRAMNDLFKALSRLNHGPNMDKITCKIHEIADLLGDEAFGNEASILSGSVVAGDGSKYESLQTKIAA